MAKEAKCESCGDWFEIVPVHDYYEKADKHSEHPHRWTWRYGAVGKDDYQYCPGRSCSKLEPHRNKDERERRDVDPLTGEVLK
jgi:hypothetical protein